jgi:hypothetical protein
VVAQDQHVVGGEIARDRFALGEVRGDALVGVIAGLGDDGERVLGERQQPSFCVATLVPACVWVWMQQAASGAPCARRCES